MTRLVRRLRVLAVALITVVPLLSIPVAAADPPGGASITGTNNFAGGFIEGIVNDSTKQFADAAAAAGVPIKYVVRPQGSHSWGLFESEMQDSWNATIGPALGV